MRQIRTARTGLFTALVALAAAGCGSTVAGPTASVATGGQSGQGLSVPAATGGPAGSVAGGGTPGSPGGSALGGAAGGGAGSTGSGPGTGPVGSGPGAPGTGGGSTPGSVGADGPGVTATTINFGLAYDPDAAAADSALGAANLDPGDTKAENTAVVDYINDHGGIAGRKVVPIWYKASASQNANTTYQQMCSAWTQDSKAFIIEPASPILDECAARAHILQAFTGGITVESSQVTAKYPADVDIVGMTNDRGMKLTIEGLAKQGYFSSGAKVGIATWDDPMFSWSVQHAAVPALAKLGITNVPVEYISPPQSYGELGATSASVSSAILKFQQMGVDHALLFDGAVGINSSGILILEWMNQAQSQHYTPRYGLNSTSGFTAIASDVPQRQMQGAIGVGWVPELDVPQSDYPASKLPATGKLCIQIMNKAGQPASTANQLAVALAICDKFFFLKQVLDPVRGALNQQTALAAINAVRGAFTPASTFGAFLSAQRHDGVSLIRNVAFDGSCTCYHYTSRPYSLGG